MGFRPISCAEPTRRKPLSRYTHGARARHEACRYSYAGIPRHSHIVITSCKASKSVAFRLRRHNIIIVKAGRIISIIVIVPSLVARSIVLLLLLACDDDDDDDDDDVPMMTTTRTGTIMMLMLLMIAMVLHMSSRTWGRRSYTLIKYASLPATYFPCSDHLYRHGKPSAGGGV